MKYLITAILSATALLFGLAFQSWTSAGLILGAISDTMALPQILKVPGFETQGMNWAAGVTLGLLIDGLNVARLHRKHKKAPAHQSRG